MLEILIKIVVYTLYLTWIAISWSGLEYFLNNIWDPINIFYNSNIPYWIIEPICFSIIVFLLLFVALLPFFLWGVLKTLRKLLRFIQDIGFMIDGLRWRPRTEKEEQDK